MDMKFDTECNKYKNYLQLYFKKVYNLGATTYCLSNKYKTVCLYIRTFFGIEMTTLISTFTINYRIEYLKNDIPISYMGNSELVREEINIVYTKKERIM